MADLKLILIGALCMLFIPDVSGMDCDFGVSCPTIFHAKDQKYCCYKTIVGTQVPYCCTLGDYFLNHPAALTGLIVGCIAIVVVTIILSCRFCSCCYLARRMQSGRVY